MTPVLRSLVELSALPLKGVETDFAADSTGFSTCRFVRWYDHKWGSESSDAHKATQHREWIKLHAMTGVRTNIVTAVEVSGWRSHDTNYFRPMLATTAENFTLRDVTADKAYSSKKNLQAVADADGTPTSRSRLTGRLGRFRRFTTPMPLCRGSGRVPGLGCTTCSPTSGIRSCPLPPAVERRNDLLHDQGEVRRLPASPSPTWAR